MRITPMVTEKDLEALLNKVDEVVDKQYSFIKEMKGIKQTIWELRATARPEVVATEEVVEAPMTVPATEEVVGETSTVEEVVAEVPSVAEEVVTEVPPIVEETEAEISPAAGEMIPEAPQIIEEPKKAEAPAFEKSIGDMMGLKTDWDWERFIGENLFSKIGIAIILIGVFIGVKYSIDHNLISPAMRLALGYLTGVGLFVFGAILKKKYTSFSAVLVSGAMAIFYFVTFVAYSMFGYFGQEVTFGLMFLFTAFTIAAALNYNQVVIAIIGLVGSYAVPFLLSNNSGRVDILFIYTAIINVGVIVISFYKQWRSLFVSAFLITWLLLLSMWGLAYQPEHFGAFFSFSIVTFLTFYASFIAQKIQKGAELSSIDVTVFLANSLLFYSIGAWLLNEQYNPARTPIALFTLANALLHFAIASYFHHKQVHTNLKYLVLVLALSFATLVIPIQFEGTWITLLWSVEAALLFWFGRTKKLILYERISYAVMTLATISWVIDISTFDYTVPFANSLFINSLLYSVAMGWVAYTHYRHKTDKDYNTLAVVFNALSVIPFYDTFTRQINLLWELRALQFNNGVFDNVLHNDAELFKQSSIIIYTLLFVGLYSWINRRYMKSKLLAEIQIVVAFLIGTVFITLGLYNFSELRGRYIAFYNVYQLSWWFLNVRYIGIAAFVVLCYTIYRLQQYLEFKEQPKKVLELLFHLVCLWIGSSELLHWTELYDATANYKLGLTILWGAYAVLLIVMGIFNSKKYLRLSGIILISFCVLKLFFYDITHLDTLRKTVVFVLLGVLLMIASFLYNKYTAKDKDK